MCKDEGIGMSRSVEHGTLKSGTTNKKLEKMEKGNRMKCPQQKTKELRMDIFSLGASAGKKPSVSFPFLPAINILEFEHELACGAVGMCSNVFLGESSLGKLGG